MIINISHQYNRLWCWRIILASFLISLGESFPQEQRQVTNNNGDNNYYFSQRQNHDLVPATTTKLASQDFLSPLPPKRHPKLSKHGPGNDNNNAFQDEVKQQQRNHFFPPSQSSSSSSQFSRPEEQLQLQQPTQHKLAPMGHQEFNVRRERSQEQQVIPQQRFLEQDNSDGDDGDNKDGDGDGDTTKKAADATTSSSLTSFLRNNSNSSSSSSLNTTALSLSACENIDRAVLYLTSLNWNLTNLQTVAAMNEQFKQEQEQEKNAMGDEDTADGDANAPSNAFLFTTTTITRMITLADQRAEYRDIYLIQGFFVVPLSLGLLLFGSFCLWPACILAAAALGIFLVFHSLPRWLSTVGGEAVVEKWLDCPMKLSLSIVSAIISAVLASTFLRFGIFCLGAMTAGSATYLIMDAFPQLDVMYYYNDDNNGGDNYFTTTSTAVVGDPMEGDTTWSYSSSSELSPFGWFLTVLMGVVGGWVLRWNEEATLEFITSLLGGMGLSYSLHTTVLLQGGSLDRSWVFLCASLTTLLGWYCQRRRRLNYNRYERYRQLKQHDGDSFNVGGGAGQPQTNGVGNGGAILPPQPPPAPMSSSGFMLNPQFHALQAMLHSMAVPPPQPPPASSYWTSSNPPTTTTASASPEQISQLLTAIHSLNDRLGSNSGQNSTTTTVSPSSSSATTTSSAPIPNPSHSASAQVRKKVKD